MRCMVAVVGRGLICTRYAEPLCSQVFLRDSLRSGFYKRALKARESGEAY